MLLAQLLSGMEISGCVSATGCFQRSSQVKGRADVVDTGLRETDLVDTDWALLSWVVGTLEYLAANMEWASGWAL